MNKTEQLLVHATNLSVDSIVWGKFRVRFNPDANYIDELAESINIEGQLKPIVVRSCPEEGGKWEGIDGEHRWCAMKKLSRPSIRAEIVGLNDEQAMARALIINMLHGKKLDKFEVAAVVKKFKDGGKSERQTAQILGKSLGWVSHALSIATKASEGVSVHAREHHLDPTDVREIVKLPKDQQDKVADVVVREGLSSRDTGKLVQAVKANPSDIDRISSLPKPELEAELAGMTEIKTGQDAEEFGEALKGKVVDGETHGKCPGCGKPFTINWEEAIIEWQ
jgi:ParB/RepB/Spo0J family partition protein